MATDNIPSDRKYTKDHEWTQEGSGSMRVGITAYAVDQLGDITLVNIDVKPGDAIVAGKAFGTIESVKTLSDLFAPVSGTVAAVNTELDNHPEFVNDDCYGKAWMVEIKPSDPREYNALLDGAQYQALLQSVSH